MTSRIITPVFRVSYPFLLEPKEQTNSNGSVSYLYEVTMIFEPDVDFGPVLALFQEAVKEKWGNNIPATGVIKPWRKGEMKNPETNPRGFDLTKNPEYTGKIIMRASSYTSKFTNGQYDTSKQPGIAGPNKLPILDFSKEPIYAGMYAMAEISMYAPKNKEAGNRVSCGIHNIIKIRDGEAFGAANAPVDKVFAAIEVPTDENSDFFLDGI